MEKNTIVPTFYDKTKTKKKLFKMDDSEQIMKQKANKSSKYTGTLLTFRAQKAA